MQNTQGENKSAEELGFNTDLHKAQVITKDESKVLDADLHTDLLNKDERDKIVEAGEVITAVIEGSLTNGEGGVLNTIKELLYGDLLKKDAEKYPGYEKLGINVYDKNGNIDPDILNEKANRVQEFIDTFLANRDFEGENPTVLIGDLPEGEISFVSVKENIIAIDRKILANADENKVLEILAHELGHFNSYDTNEDTANRIAGQIDNPKNEAEYTEKYEKDFQKNYGNRDISGEKAQNIINNIPEENKEKLTIGISRGISGAFIAKGGLGGTFYTIINTDNLKESEGVITFDTSLGAGSPDLSGGYGILILPTANSKEDVKGSVISVGSGAGFFGNLGIDIVFSTNGTPLGVKFSITGTPFPVPVEGHISYDHSTIISSKKLKIPYSSVKLSEDLINEYKKDPTSPEVYKLGKKIYDEIEEANK